MNLSQFHSLIAELEALGRPVGALKVCAATIESKAKMHRLKAKDVDVSSILGDIDAELKAIEAKNEKAPFMSPEGLEFAIVCANAAPSEVGSRDVNEEGIRRPAYRGVVHQG